MSSDEPANEETPQSAATDVESDAADVESRSPAFPHPPWTVGVVLVLGGASLLFGILVRPIFLAVGSPFIIVLLLWLYVKLSTDDSAS